MDDVYFSLRAYQWIIYIFTLGVFGSLLYFTKNRARYSKVLYAGFVIWALGHLAGMGLIINGEPLYSHIIIPISNSLPVIRFDQIVHAFGFGISTLLVYELIGHRVKKLDKFSLGLVVIMGGLGIGAVNEIVEFIVSRIVPDSNVGAYENTSLDLVADLIGGIIAWIYITSCKTKKSIRQAINTT